MNRATKVGTLGIAALALTSVSYGETGTPTNEELQQRVAALEAKLAATQAASNDGWLTEARADEIRGLVYDVLSDADTRASLLQGGGSAGYDDGFVVSSSGGNFMLRINGWLQTTWLYNHADDNAAPGPPFPVGIDESIAGFQNTQTKLRFSGHVVDPSWTYAIQGGFSETGGGFGLEDAWVQYDYGNGWTARMGQFKMPLMRESLVSSRYLLSADRSLVSEWFSPGTFNGNDANRVQGIMFAYSDDQMRFAVSFNDGWGIANANVFGAPPGFGPTEYAVTGRIEALLAGNWDQFEDFTNPQGGAEGWLVGAAVHYEEGESGTAAFEAERTIVTADVSGEFDGANVFAAFTWSNLDSNAPAFVDTDDMGLVIQGGVHISPTTEIFARYEWGDFETLNPLNFPGVQDDLSIITVGVNEYFSRHQVKWTTEVGFGIDSVPGGFTATGVSTSGWRDDVGAQDGQFLVKTQLQLLF